MDRTRFHENPVYLSSSSDFYDEINESKACHNKLNEYYPKFTTISVLSDRRNGLLCRWALLRKMLSLRVHQQPPRPYVFLHLEHGKTVVEFEAPRNDREVHKDAPNAALLIIHDSNLEKIGQRCRAVLPLPVGVWYKTQTPADEGWFRSLCIKHSNLYVLASCDGKNEVASLALLVLHLVWISHWKGGSMRLHRVYGDLTADFLVKNNN